MEIDTQIDGLSTENQTKDIQIVNQKKTESVPVYFTDQELSCFFMAIPEKKARDKVLFLTLLGTGRRVSEILALKKNDIDFQSRYLRIRTLKKRKLKTETIRIPQQVAYWLSVYVGPLRAEDPVFDISRQYADELCKKYARKAGITYKKTSCHVFRHTFAVRWLEQGKPIHKLKRHLGHSHIQTTMVYLRIVDKDYDETVDSLDILGFYRGDKQ